MEFKRNLIEEIPVYVFQKYGMYYYKLRLLKLSSNRFLNDDSLKVLLLIAKVVNFGKFLNIFSFAIV
jgi:hypothetical protein